MITQYLETVLGEGAQHNTSKGIQYSYKCPLCDDWKERLFINITRQVFLCHNCEKTGSIITFISLFHNIPWFDALKVFRDYEGYDRILPEELSTEIYDRLSRVEPKQFKKYVYPLPEEFILLENATGRAGRKAVEYVRSRGISMKAAEKYYIGYCAEGEYENRIIMPDFEDGELIYWQGRTWLPTPTSKMEKRFFRKAMNPSLTEEQIAQGIKAVDKSEVVGNIDLIREEGVAVLCEGKFDAYTIGDMGACLHGKYLSDTQFIKLINAKDKIQSVIVMIDGDALKNAISVADRLYKHYEDVSICKLPDDKDPNSLGKKGVLDALVNALPYNSLFSVKARLKGWI